MFVHTHPDAFSIPAPSDTHFSVRVALNIAQEYALAVSFFIDADATGLCISESDMHSHGPSLPVGVPPSSLAEVTKAVLRAIVAAAVAENASAREAQGGSAFIPTLQHGMEQERLWARLCEC